MAASLVFRLHDRGPELVREVLLERGWEEYDKEARGEEDWNLYWRGSAFRNSEYHNLLPWQRLNHHPKTAGITRKDYLARNLRRMRATFSSNLYDFSPTVFILANDYARFLAEYNALRRSGGSGVYWICKPVDLSRGRGIFIFEDIKDLAYDCSVIVQRYVSDPLLISGYKFDLRIYACAKSFHPLTVYIHQEGLVRFATEKYDLSSLRNLYSHLTNTSINKLGPFYKAKKESVGQGCKWTLGNFRRFLHGQDVDEIAFWQKINNIVTLTLLAIAPTVPFCPNCVELFGFDILVDAEWKPWLLEVNYSPALGLDCQADIAVKKGLIGDLIDLMNYTLIDRLRERAYRRKEYRQRCHSKPVRSTINEAAFQRRRTGSQCSKTQSLPLLKTLRQPEKMNQKQARQRALGTEHRRHLPPVDLNKMHAARPGIINSAATDAHADKTLNLTLGPQSRTNESVVNRRTCAAPARRPEDGGRPRTSEVTRRGDAETEAATEPAAGRDASSSTRDTGLLGRSTRSSELPPIRSCSQKPARTPSERSAARNAPRVPPLRVGDFIRTFPFNAATLRASRHPLDVKAVVRELHKLTGRLATPDERRGRGGEGEERRSKDGDEDFDSLLWGPKNPPLLSHCLKPS